MQLLHSPRTNAAAAAVSVFSDCEEHSSFSAGKTFVCLVVGASGRPVGISAVKDVERDTLDSRGLRCEAEPTTGGAAAVASTRQFGDLRREHDFTIEVSEGRVNLAARLLANQSAKCVVRSCRLNGTSPAAFFRWRFRSERRWKSAFRSGAPTTPRESRRLRGRALKRAA